MRILVFSWRDPVHPLAGGAEQVMHEHMKGWVAAGHKVTLFSSRFGYGSRPKEELVDGVKIVRGGYQYIGVQIAAVFYYFTNRGKYDFIVDQFHGLPFFTPIYSRKPKVAVIQEPAKQVWFENPLPRPINWIVGIIGYLGEPLVFFPYLRTHFITGSNSAKEDILKYRIPSNNISVIPHGALIAKLKQPIKKEKTKTVAFLGILSKDKGIEDALECFHILSQKDYNFWVIGKPETTEYEKKLKKLVAKSKFKKRVKFWGFVSQEKKFDLLKKSHVLINPSKHEGWGLVNIEANAMGVPVVAYRSQGLIDSVKSGYSGILCPKNTPKAMATEVINLLSNKKRYDKIAHTSILWSQNFSWEKSKAKSLKLLLKVYEKNN